MGENKDRTSLRDYGNMLFVVGVKLEIVFLVLLILLYFLWQVNTKMGFLISWMAWGIFFYYITLQVAKLIIYVVESVHRKKWKFGFPIGIESIPPWAMIISYLIVLVIFLGVTVRLIIQAVDAIFSAIDFVSTSFGNTSTFQKWLEIFLYRLGLTQEQAIDIAHNIINNVFIHSDLLTTLTEKMLNFVSSLSFFFDVMAGAFISILIGVEAKRIKKLVSEFGKSKRRILRNVARDLKIIHFYMVGFTGNRLIIAFIVGLVVWLGFLIAGFPNAGISALIAIITDLIPYVGPLLGWSFGILAVIPLIPTWKAFFLLSTIYVIAQVVENVVAPLMYSTNLSVPFWIVMLALIVGGKLGGVVGIIVGVPLLAAFFKIITIYFRDWESGHGKYLGD